MASENLDSRKASKKLAEKPNSSTVGGGRGMSTFSESLKIAATSPNVPTVRTNSSCGSLLAGTAICKASGSLLNPAFEADSADIVRLLVPTYADPNRQIQDPRNPFTYSLLARSLHHGCRAPTLLLELGASPNFAPAYLPIHQLAIHGVKKEKTADCLVAAKSLVAAGYVPSQKDLDSALSVALNGCCGWGNRLPQYHNVPNVGLVDYLRSIGAVEPR